MKIVFYIIIVGTLTSCASLPSCHESDIFSRVYTSIKYYNEPDTLFELKNQLKGSAVWDQTNYYYRKGVRPKVPSNIKLDSLIENNILLNINDTGVIKPHLSFKWKDNKAEGNERIYSLKLKEMNVIKPNFFSHTKESLKFYFSGYLPQISSWTIDSVLNSDSIIYRYIHSVNFEDSIKFPFNRFYSIQFPSRGRDHRHVRENDTLLKYHDYYRNINYMSYDTNANDYQFLSFIRINPNVNNIKSYASENIWLIYINYYLNLVDSETYSNGISNWFNESTLRNFFYTIGILKDDHKRFKKFIRKKYRKGANYHRDYFKLLLWQLYQPSQFKVMDNHGKQRSFSFTSNNPDYLGNYEVKFNIYEPYNFKVFKR